MIKKIVISFVVLNMFLFSSVYAEIENEVFTEEQEDVPSVEEEAFEEENDWSFEVDTEEIEILQDLRELLMRVLYMQVIFVCISLFLLFFIALKAGNK